MNILIVLRAQKDNSELSKVTPAHLQKIKKTLKGSKVKVLEQDSKNLANELKKVDILITSAIDLVNLENAPNLKWIHLTSAGANRLPKEILESDIIVTNSSGVHPIPISEHVFGLMLMFSMRKGLPAVLAAELQIGEIDVISLECDKYRWRYLVLASQQI